MGRLLIRGAHVVTPGKDLGVTDVVIEGDRVASVVAFHGNVPTGESRVFHGNAPTGEA